MNKISEFISKAFKFIDKAISIVISLIAIVILVLILIYGCSLNINITRSGDPVINFTINENEHSVSDIINKIKDEEDNTDSIVTK